MARRLAQRRLSWRKLADLVGYTPSWLSKVKNGAPPSLELARRCDEVLDAAGQLVALAEVEGDAVPPAQLPAVTACFTGREHALRRLDDAVERPAEPGAPAVLVIDGPPGAGKTALALRWAHQVTDRFPDGQLYVDLRGYTATGLPLAAEEALEEFLRALGTPARSIPATVGQRSALYRSLLATQRVLVVLDNAAHPGQVEPLLPGSAECAVVVTSRSHLSGLGVRAGARHITIGSMPTEESVALLHGILGDEPLREEPDAVWALADRCAHLPLALRIAAERVAASPDHSVADVVAQLAAEGLDLLTLDDTTAVCRVFSWSYRTLTRAAARLFRLSSLLPGPHFGTAVAAVLAEVPVSEARRLIDILVDAHLLESLGHGRYRLHDLLRSYADERSRAEDGPADRAGAIRRLVEWYLGSAVAATVQIAPFRTRPPDLAPTGTDVAAMTFTDPAAALRWCETENHNFAPISRLALEHGMADAAWKLAMALFDYFLLRKPWSAWLATHDTALRAAQDTGARHAQSWLRINLAVAHAKRRDLDRGHRLYREALDISTQLDDQHGRGWALYGLAGLLCERGQHQHAREHAEQALTLFKQLDEQEGQAVTLAVLGEIHRQTGQCDAALAATQQALRLCEKQSNHYGRGRKLAKIAKIYLARGDRERALQYLALSLEVRQETGDRWGQADTHLLRGDILRDLGHTEAAHTAWTAALQLYQELDDPRATDATGRLNTSTHEKCSTRDPNRENN
ncbi:ATP-binding protein [Amycolatopsis anabasis]|uniref:ATP-binding protein n=1 Tax=Amycolatopsis anabasis TaxID=1840409 RepID=UPI0031B632F2